MGNKVVNHCKECGEKLPQYARICPYCLYIEFFDSECRCHLTPEPYLKIMRGYMDEMRALPKVSMFGFGFDRNALVVQELIDSFEIVESVLDSTFCDNSDVVEAVMLMSMIMDEEVLSRRRAMHKSRFICTALVIVVALLSLVIVWL